MPMKLTKSSLLQMLLRRRDIVALRQVCDNLLSNPASVEQTRLRIGEAPLQIGNGAAVSWLLAQIVWILKV
jgi:hypothetical protein